MTNKQMPSVQVTMEHVKELCAANALFATMLENIALKHALAQQVGKDMAQKTNGKVDGDASGEPSTEKRSRRRPRSEEEAAARL